MELSYAALVLTPSARKPKSSPPPPLNKLRASHSQPLAVGIAAAAKAGGAGATSGVHTSFNLAWAQSVSYACAVPLRVAAKVSKSTLSTIEVCRLLMSSRPHSPSLDELLGRELPVLNHGFVRVVDYMGDDDAIVQAARVSYGAGTKGVRNDRALIRYLLSHSHTTPFEMAEIKLHVKLPIFVARQWIRHRTASVNEYSARYSVVEDESYLPDPAAIAAQSTTNRQGRGTELERNLARDACETIEEAAKRAYADYRKLLNEGEDGKPLRASEPALARELARSVLPVSFYTQWYWKSDLHNLMRFLELRMDQHAQWEIRQYANVIAGVVAKWVPHTWEAFCDYRLERLELSGPALKIIRRWLAGEPVSAEQSGLSRREWEGLVVALGRKEP